MKLLKHQRLKVIHSHPKSSKDRAERVSLAAVINIWTVHHIISANGSSKSLKRNGLDMFLIPLSSHLSPRIAWEGDRQQENAF